jgi:hypothetical protein
VQRVDGYIATLVAGQPIFERGEHTGAMPGRLVRARSNETQIRRQNSGWVLRNCLHTNWNVRTRAPHQIHQHGPSRINGVRQVAVTFPAVRKALRLRGTMPSKRRRTRRQKEIGERVRKRRERLCNCVNLHIEASRAY